MRISRKRGRQIGEFLRAFSDSMPQPPEGMASAYTEAKIRDRGRTDREVLIDAAMRCGADEAKANELADAFLTGEMQASIGRIAKDLANVV